MAVSRQTVLDRGNISELSFVLKGFALGTALKKLATPTAEALTVTSNAGTLAHIPASVLSVYATAGTAGGVKKIIPVAQTPATGEVAVDYVAKTLTFFGTDAVSAAEVVYHEDGGLNVALAVDIADGL